MKTIHKFQLPSTPGIVSLRIRKNAKFLKAMPQRDIPTLWYEVNTHEVEEERNFIIYHTGDTLDSQLHPRCEYVASFLLFNDNYVLHLYEIKPSN